MNMKEIVPVMVNKWLKQKIMNWTTSTTGNNIDPQYMISLYDYLGKAAGLKLGKEVNEAAKSKKIPVAVKEVSNIKYTGKVMMYPKYFLDEYFGKNKESKLPF